MSQDQKHLNQATWECKYMGVQVHWRASTMSCSRRSTARSCCLGKSGRHASVTNLPVLRAERRGDLTKNAAVYF